jgi:hypothetical protein
MNTDTHSRIISVEGDIITVDFDAMQNMTPEQKLQQMIGAGNYDWVSPAITANRFRFKGTGVKRFRNTLFGFGRVSSEDAMTAMKKEKFMPATHVHGFAFGATFPDEQRKFRIACLGSSALVDGDRGVVCLYGSGVKRNLHLYDWGGGWNDSWRFLGVQEVSAA